MGREKGCGRREGLGEEVMGRGEGKGMKWKLLQMLQLLVREWKERIEGAEDKVRGMRRTERDGEIEGEKRRGREKEQGEKKGRSR